MADQNDFVVAIVSAYFLNSGPPQSSERFDFVSFISDWFELGVSMTWQFDPEARCNIDQTAQERTELRKRASKTVDED
jgi:hypothetical protein